MPFTEVMAECQYHYYSTRSSASTNTEKEALNTKTMVYTELFANKTRYSKALIVIKQHTFQSNNRNFNKNDEQDMSKEVMYTFMYTFRLVLISQSLYLPTNVCI